MKVWILTDQAAIKYKDKGVPVSDVINNRNLSKHTIVDNTYTIIDNWTFEASDNVLYREELINEKKYNLLITNRIDSSHCYFKTDKIYNLEAGKYIFSLDMFSGITDNISANRVYGEFILRIFNKDNKEKQVLIKKALSSDTAKSQNQLSEEDIFVETVGYFPNIKSSKSVEAFLNTGLYKQEIPFEIESGDYIQIELRKTWGARNTFILMSIPELFYNPFKH